MCRDKIKSTFQLKVDEQLKDKIKCNFTDEFNKREKYLVNNSMIFGDMIKIKVLAGNKHKDVVTNGKNKHEWTAFVACEDPILNTQIHKLISKVTF